MVLTTHCKQRIVQLYFKQRVSYGNIANILAAEGLKVPKKMVWAMIKKYKEHGAIYSRRQWSDALFALAQKTKMISPRTHVAELAMFSLCNAQTAQLAVNA